MFVGDMVWDRNDFPGSIFGVFVEFGFDSSYPLRVLEGGGD